MKKFGFLGVFAAISASCSHREVPNETLKSPNEDYVIEVFEKDLGACCLSVFRANIISNAENFRGLSEKLFLIKGGSDVRIVWNTPYFIEVQVCNAKSISYRSDFPNSNFSDHIHVIVTNLNPERIGGQVTCPNIN